MKRKLLLLGCLLIVLTTALFHSSQINAVTSGPDGLSVSPAFQQINLKSNEPKTTANFIITNNTNYTVNLNLSVNDFNTLGESGGLFFAGTNPTQLQKKYGLAKWASLPANQISLAAKHTQTITVDILNQPTLLPGGHYGALMVSISNSDNKARSGNQVDVQPVTSALMFVTKLGGDTHKLELKAVVSHHSIFSLPKTVDLKFHNSGNTHITPRGVVSVLSPSGKLISKGIVNESSSLVLPETDRIFSVQVNNIGNALWPGRYKLRAEVRFDGLNQTRIYQSSFFVIPLFSQILIILLLLTSIIVYFRHRKFKSKSNLKS